jgi:hypothetical protein
MLKDQGNKCAICGSLSPGKKETSFHVDHDHETGKVRGLLCELCNVGLGYFKTPKELRAAAAYLEQFSLSS